jgi:MoCo/4Fe-4S cofactor protein with predicted Tat translocation signal
LRERLQGAGGRRYWRGVEELMQDPAFEEWLHQEFASGTSTWWDGLSRRHFLKLMGASMALAGLTACTRQPIEPIVPYIHQPEGLVLGRALFYATAATLGGFATGLLVESHEGHPTKVEGNPDHPMSRGATQAWHQASILDLYDPDRSQAVLNGGQISSWEVFLSALHDALQVERKRRGAGLRLLTETVTSPSLGAQIEALLKVFPEARWHQFEPLPRDNVLEGARLAFGQDLETQHELDKARVILSLDSDFLYSHPASLRYARQFADSRRVTGGRAEMSRLYVAETTPSVTGSNADHRLGLRAEAIEGLAWSLAQRLGALPGPGPAVAPETDVPEKWLSALVSDLSQGQGASVVLVGDQQAPVVHALAHLINHHLRNVGATVRYSRSAVVRPEPQGDSLRELVEAMNAGRVTTLVMLGGNPAYNTPADLEFARHLSNVGLRVHLSSEVNETSALCQWHIPQNHFLECWGDARAFDGTVSLIQPLIQPLYEGKSPAEVIEAMLIQPGRNHYDIVRDYWQGQKLWPEFESGWRRALHDGVIAGSAFPLVTPALRAFANSPPTPGPRHTLEVVFRPDPTVGDGRFANNGWLQELPKPLTKLTWDNAALVGVGTAERHGLVNGDVIELEHQGRRLEAAVWVQPGHAEDCVTLHVGYGRTRTGRVGTGTGFNAYRLQSSLTPWGGTDVRLTRTGRRYPLVSTQLQHAIDSESREILREGTLQDFLRDPNFVRVATALPPREETLFRPHEHDYDGHRWGMSIDLTACIGCNACMLACQAENNIPVVGKDQVGRGRVMHWIRVDTYFQGGLEAPLMTHQPVPCMQCENAPCELVCPVGATLHDKEGLNVQVYNRCIGTRYCSNNCPYKVRRFNFLQYADYTTPSLKPLRNPNVTVRWRGVMEKCTYCVQRISAARITAKKEDRPIREGEVRTACQQVCPAQAIVFGDLSDAQSQVSRLKALGLDYSMLGELNTRPRTTYLAKLRNPHPSLAHPEPSLAAQPAHA